MTDENTEYVELLTSKEARRKASRLEFQTTKTPTVPPYMKPYTIKLGTQNFTITWNPKSDLSEVSPVEKYETQFLRGVDVKTITSGTARVPYAFVIDSVDSLMLILSDLYKTGHYAKPAEQGPAQKEFNAIFGTADPKVINDLRDMATRLGLNQDEAIGLLRNMIALEMNALQGKVYPVQGVDIQSVGLPRDQRLGIANMALETAYNMIMTDVSAAVQRAYNNWLNVLRGTAQTVQALIAKPPTGLKPGEPATIGLTGVTLPAGALKPPPGLVVEAEVPKPGEQTRFRIPYIEYVPEKAGGVSVPPDVYQRIYVRFTDRLAEMQAALRKHDPTPLPPEIRAKAESGQLTAAMASSLFGNKLGELTLTAFLTELRLIEGSPQWQWMPKWLQDQVTTTRARIEKLIKDKTAPPGYSHSPLETEYAQLPGGLATARQEIDILPA